MSATTLAASYLAELGAEAPATRKCLERIPMELKGWKPHDKSMAMGYLALIVAEIPKWVATMATEPGIDFALFEHPKPQTTAELVAYFDANMEAARKALNGPTDEFLSGPFELKNNGQLLFTMPRKDNISSTLRHWMHHRGQLTVYMRLNDLAVPALFGPSADEGGF